MNLASRIKGKNCKDCKYSVIYKGGNIYCENVEKYIREQFKKGTGYAARECIRYTEEANKEYAGRIKQLDALKFMLAGNSEFVLYSDKTKEDYGYKLEAMKKQEDKRANEEQNLLDNNYFVHVVVKDGYVYAGYIRYNSNKGCFEFIQGDKGKYNERDMLIRSLLMVLNRLVKGEYIEHLAVYHMNKCGICKNHLHSPYKINDIGICESCIDKFNMMSIKRKIDEHDDSDEWTYADEQWGKNGIQ